MTSTSSVILSDAHQWSALGTQHRPLPIISFRKDFITRMMMKMRRELEIEEAPKLHAGRRGGESLISAAAAKTP